MARGKRKKTDVDDKIPCILEPELSDKAFRAAPDGPPIDMFPAYDEQPGPSTDDYIRDPHYPAEAYF